MPRPRGGSLPGGPEELRGVSAGEEVGAGGAEPLGLCQSLSRLWLLSSVRQELVAAELIASLFVS